MAGHYTPKEIDALEGCSKNKEYVAKHEQLFPVYYKESVLSGVKRASTIWWKREKLLAKLKGKRDAEAEKAHLIKIKQLTKTEPVAPAKKQEPVPDDGEILIKILQELRIHTKQYDDLLAIARAPKSHIPYPMTTAVQTPVSSNPFMPISTSGVTDVNKH